MTTIEQKLRFSRIDDRKRHCGNCNRHVDIVVAFIGEDRATVTSRHLAKIGRGFCIGSLEGLEDMG